MKKMILYILLLPWIGVACMEDKGTYDYREVNEITIDTLRNQTKEVYDTLTMEPKVNCTLPTKALEYCWYRYTNEGLKVDTLSTEEKLSYKVSLRVGNYQIFLKVTDVSSGLSAKTTFNLRVVGKFSTGLMILGEEDGETAMSFINNAGNVTHLYGPGNSSDLGRHPVLIADASSIQISYVTDMLVLCNDERGGVTLRNEDFSKAADYSDLFYVRPGSINPQAYYKGVDMMAYGTMADFIISGGKLHARLLAASEMQNKQVGFNPPVNGDYDLSPWAIVTGKDYLFYDNKNESFLVLKGNMMSINKSFSSLVSSSSGFDPSHVGMQLVYMAEGKAAGSVNRGFGIFRNSQNQLIRLIFSLGGYSDSWSGTNNMTLLSRTEVTPEAADIDKSNGYAMSLAKPYLYFTKGSKVYLYELENNLCIPVYDVDTVVNNSTVDQVYMEYVPYYMGYGTASENYNKVLYVASSENNASGKNGTIHILRLADNGTVERRTALHKNICGKTVSLCYRRAFDDIEY